VTLQDARNSIDLMNSKPRTPPTPNPATEPYHRLVKSTSNCHNLFP